MEIVSPPISRRRESWGGDSKAASSRKPWLSILVGLTLLCVGPWSTNRAIAETVSTNGANSYSVFAGGCFKHVNSRKDFDADMKRRGLAPAAKADLKLKNEVLNSKLRVNADSVSAWIAKDRLSKAGAEPATFTVLWAEASAYNGKRWIPATLCSVHAESGMLRDMKELSWLFRDLSFADQPTKICCYAVPGYSPYLTVFQDQQKRPGKSGSVQDYAWTRFTVLYSDGFNEQFKRIP